VAGLGGALRGLAGGYRREWELFRTRYWRAFAAAGLVLVLGALAAYFYFGAHPSQSEAAISSLRKSVLGKLPRTASGLPLLLAIFWNNLRASLIALFLGVAPYLSLALMLPLINGGALGLLISALRAKGLSVPLVLVVDMAPHGVFEIAGWLYASALGVYFSWQLGKRLFAPRAAPGAQDAASPAPEGVRLDLPARGEDSLLRQALVSFARVVIPLLVAAAVIEAFVTPALHRAVFG
jgi:stage II sporulation protein M